jgi:hypothetical protein
MSEVPLLRAVGQLTLGSAGQRLTVVALAAQRVVAAESRDHDVARGRHS